ncbi:MAG: ABC transporter ATP-binding protein [Spirochaetales bacterium]|nr:ABC transporter ATP-binding protein [Spirochaetales bacterium]
MLLELKDLKVSFDTYAGEVQAVRGVSFSLDKGEVVALVGESGCGKSVTAQSVMGLLAKPAGRIKSGSIKIEGVEASGFSEKQWEGIRGKKIGMIFQDPMTSLNPTMTIGAQISEGLIRHQGMNKKQALERAEEMLKLVEIPNVQERIHQYPHEFSGGMRQRAMIAIALACNPELVIADEPTTALDVTIQAQVLDLLKNLQQKLETAVIIITHDLGVVASIAQRVMVMYGGIIVEAGNLKDIYYEGKHPYTWGLMKSIPRLDRTKADELSPIEGTPPDLFAPPAGCPFADRCDWCMKVCKTDMPPLHKVSETHSVACWLLHDGAPKVESPLVPHGATGARKSKGARHV